MITRRRRRATGDDGAALVEAAIILPFLVIMVFGIVELGFLFRSAAVANTSTRSGARLAASQYGSATNATSQGNVVDNVALTVERDLANRGGTDTPVQLWIYKSDANGFSALGQLHHLHVALLRVHLELGVRSLRAPERLVGITLRVRLHP